MDLNQTAWVTGASQGIGLACAQGLASAGAQVVGLDISVSAELRAVAHTAVEVDISQFDAVEQQVATLADAGLTPTIIVNNAGITRDGVLWKMTEENWDAVIAVNLKGAFNLIRHLAPLMRKQGQGGSIINVTSINGLRGKFGQSNYAASKAGLIGLTKTAARELGRAGIRVNAVAPGMVLTEMARSLPESVLKKAIDETVLGKLATVEDIADAVVFLASSASGHITGQVLQVDGGQYI
ncbi:MAG: SDR family oxidoreductase [Proteobacteria bacterium]|nr:SDR family oxidoreductase [Pseudomonadota bacterium]